MSRLRSIRRKRKYYLVPAETLVRLTGPRGETIVMTAWQAADFQAALDDPEQRAALEAYAARAEPPNPFLPPFWPKFGVVGE